MTPIEALVRAVTTMQEVIDVEPIGAEQLTAPTPCADFDVAELGDHIIANHNLFLGGTGGQPIDGGLSDSHAAIAAAAIAQWSRRGTDGAIGLGGNEVPAAFGLQLHTLETYVHAWDLASGLGRPFEPDAELTDQMWALAQDFVTDDLRGEGPGVPYRHAVEVDDDASIVDRIIAHSGRDPRRSP